MDIRRINKTTGGSTLTKVARESHLVHFDTTMRCGLNRQYKLGSLSVAQARAYFEHCKTEGVSVRTLQNRAASLRAALSTEGRDHFAQAKMTNQALGISGASRSGTHRVAEPATISERVATLSGGHAAAAGLQRALGLRAREAVSAGASLNAWERALTSGSTSILVSHGTKGGRPRAVQVRGDRAEMLSAVKAAQSAARDGRIIQSKSLAGAVRSYQRAMHAAGFRGSEASHSLRYEWAQSRYADYQAELGDERESLALLSQDLGHGDGRGRYCKSVYLAAAE